RGVLADNAAIALSPDGHRLAFIAAHEARMWDVQSGRDLKKWILPDGMADVLAFDASGERLISCRLETIDSSAKPWAYAKFPPEAYPRVCRIRDLLSIRPDTMIKQIDSIR